jgi:uncharacterized RDD family membrane protein YckC
MSGWVVPAYQPPVALPPGVMVATMGRRVGAWLLDRLLSGCLLFVPLIMAFATGAVSLDQQALDQLRDAYSYEPFDQVTAPIFDVNAGALWIVAAVYVGLSMAYFAGSWVAWGGTPGQRILGLRVGRLGDLRKLTIDAAVLRWGLLDGISLVLSTALAVQLVVEMGRMPAQDWLGSAYRYNASSTYDTLAGWSSLVGLATAIWLIVLLVSAASHMVRRGLHDRLVGSIVVGAVPATPAWPGYPPSGMPYWQPQPQGFQPPGSVPQGYRPPTGWPGYQPPAGWPGSAPQWPGYPGGPQSGSPPAGGTQVGWPPSAAPQSPPAWPGTPAPPSPAGTEAGDAADTAGAPPEASEPPATGGEEPPSG